MKTLPDHLEMLGVDLERAARGLVHKRRQRRRRVQLAALVAATATVGASAGLAASGVNVLDWLWPDDPSAVRYVVDESREYGGVAPQELECENVTAPSFPCRPIPADIPEASRDDEGTSFSFSCPDGFQEGNYPCGEPAPSQRIYQHTHWVEKAPPATRETFVAEVEALARDGAITAAQRDEFLDAIADVDDSFFVKWRRVTSVGGFDTFEEGPNGTERVPPESVPMFVTCDGESRDAITCRPLAQAETLPVGAPIYRLTPTDDWRTIPRADRSPEEQWKAFEAMWGGPMTREEARLFFLLGTAVTVTESSGGGGPATTVTAVEPDE